MADEFIEITSRSWFSRLGSAIGGILFGILLVPLSVILLIWNEEQAVTSARSLKEGIKAVVSVDSSAISPSNEGRLVHLSGDVLVEGAVRDPLFGFSAEALKLVREVEMFQWRERKHSESHKTLGGGEETLTRYTYEKVWSRSLEDSSRFKVPQDHQNPASFPVSGTTILSEKATLGAFKIPGRMISNMPKGEPFTPSKEGLGNLSPDLQARAKLSGEYIFIGTDPASPVIGDTRVSFKGLMPGRFSFLAQQKGDTLAAYPTRAGSAVERVEPGIVGAELMFQHLALNQRMMSWGLRFGGALLMLLGFAMVLRPLSVLADVVPMLGNLVGMGTGLISGVLALAISILVIAISWIAVRPVLGGALLLISGAVGVYGPFRVYMRKTTEVV